MEYFRKNFFLILINCKFSKSFSQRIKNTRRSQKGALNENFPYSELFWSAFFRIRTEYGEILRIQFEYGKMRTRIIPNTDFFYTVVSGYENMSQKQLENIFIMPSALTSTLKYSRRSEKSTPTPPPRLE